jgi:hypothetical protein
MGPWRVVLQTLSKKTVEKVTKTALVSSPLTTAQK